MSEWPAPSARRARSRRATLSRRRGARRGQRRSPCRAPCASPEMVSPNLRKRVETAVHDLAYVPNRARQRARLVAHRHASASSSPRSPTACSPTICARCTTSSCRRASRCWCSTRATCRTRRRRRSPRCSASIPEAMIARRHRPDATDAGACSSAGRHSRRADDGTRRRPDRHQYRPVAARRRLCRDAVSDRSRPSPHRQYPAPARLRARSTASTAISGRCGRPAST